MTLHQTWVSGYQFTVVPQNNAVAIKWLGRPQPFQYYSTIVNLPTELFAI